jgi:sugar phosphate isomerase/epimerase
MPQQLRVLQSLWAMERRLADEPEWPLQTQLAMIRDAGFDGAGVRFIDPDFAREVTSFLRDHGMIWQAQCYPTSVDDLKPVLELVARLGADHVNLQPNVRPHRIAPCIPLLEGWRRLADQAGIAVHVETHRDRMTTDLFFTLQLLDCFPDLRLTADISHYLVGREFAWPVDEANHAMIASSTTAGASMAGSPAANRCRSRSAFRSIKAGSNCSWAGGNTPSAPGASVQSPTPG